MRHHDASVLEIKEGGILLRGRGEHTVRVLGAHREVPLPGPVPMKEKLTPLADPAVYERYYHGELAGSEHDPDGEAP